MEGLHACWVCRGGAGPRGAVSAASSIGGFVAVHRPTVRSKHPSENTRTTRWVLLGGVCWPG